MKLPREVGVMILPNATLFPQALLPLYIFEPRYRQMLADALVSKVRELLEERINLGLPFPFPVMSPEQSKSTPAPPSFSPKEILNYLDSITDPEQAVDLVSCAVLPGAAERQSILETVDVEVRLRRVNHFCRAEIRTKRQGEEQ